MLTYEAKKTINACRFCWMCRHVCPVGVATGKENNGPRAKAMFLYLNEKKGNLECEIAQDLYECALCNACAANCETGYEPAIYIREARANLAAGGLVPEKVERVIEDLERTGNVYGANIDMQAWEKECKKDCGVLVYAGAAALIKTPENVRAFLSLLNKAGLNASLANANCGSVAAEYDLLGDVAEVREKATKCASELSSHGVEKLIVLDPSDAVMFKQKYPAWGIRVDMEVVTATSFVAGLIDAGKLNIRRQSGRVTYHDPCRLARDLDETEAARHIIAAMGYELSEMLESRKLTRCCGGQVLAAHAPEIVEKMAASRAEEAARTGAEILVTACPGCFANLDGGDYIEVADIFSLLDRCT